MALIEAGANPNAANEYSVTPLFLAATNGSTAMLDALLAAGADAGATLPPGETVLMTAVWGREPGIRQQSLGQRL